MAQQNIEVIRSLFDAYAREDNETLRQVLAEDVVYHIPGRNPLSGDYRGREAVLGLWAKQKERMGGRPYQTEFRDMAESDKHVFAWVRGRAESPGSGKILTWLTVNVYRVRNGQLTEAWMHLDDLYAFDDFWS